MSVRLDLHNFTLPPGKIVGSNKKRSRGLIRKPAGRFLRGPISWDWLTTAARLRGRALHVALVVHFLVGLNKSLTISLSGGELLRFGVPRTTAYRALAALERAGLVSIIRHRGRLPVVTVLTLL